MDHIDIDDGRHRRWHRCPLHPPCGIHNIQSLRGQKIGGARFVSPSSNGCKISFVYVSGLPPQIWKARCEISSVLTGAGRDLQYRAARREVSLQYRQDWLAIALGSRSIALGHSVSQRRPEKPRAWAQAESARPPPTAKSQHALAILSVVWAIADLRRPYKVSITHPGT